MKLTLHWIISNWLKANKLMINVKKSNLIVFKVGNSQSADETINIYTENQIYTRTKRHSQIPRSIY